MKRIQIVLMTVMIVALLAILTSCMAGESAYEIAVRNGYTGSETEWLASLNGVNGQNGTNGINGTNGVNGADGKDGASGKDGANGENGKDGVGVASVTLDEKGYLIVTLTNGATVNAGYVGLAIPDTSTEAPKLNAASLNIPTGSAYILTSDRPNTVFESSNSEIIQISPEGLILAVGEGSATITATARDGKATTCTVNSLAYSYKKLPSGGVAITGYTGDLTELNIPENIMGMAVTEIGDGAFADYSGESKITSVTLPDSVTAIGSYSFNSLNNLVDVKFGKNLKYIGFNAFSGCEKLNGVVLPETLQSLGNAAFNMCSSLTEIVIPNGIPEITGSAFYGCEKLMSVTIGSGVKSIGYSAFEFCTSLTELVIPSQVIFIDEYAFANCEKLAEVKLGAGCGYDEATSFINTPWFEANKETITPSDSFTEVNETVWVYTTDNDDNHLAGADSNYYATPSFDNRLGSLLDGTELTRTGVLYEDAAGLGWSRLIYKGQTIYMRNSQITTTAPVA